MDRRVMLAVATVLSFAGVLGLYFYSCSLQPVQLRLGEIGPEDMGNVVRTSGHVTDLHTTSNGDLIVDLVDYEDGSTLTVYIPVDVASSMDGTSSLLPGTEIEVVGDVQEYSDELELTVNSGDGVTVLKGPEELVLTVETLARNPGLFVGHETTVSGQIWNIKASSVHIEGGPIAATVFQLLYPDKYVDFTIDCLLIGYDVSDDFYQGQSVRFTGIFQYYELEAKYRIVSEEMTLQS